MIVIRPYIEMDFGSGWVDVSDDVVSSVKAEWGIKGSDPKDRVAEPGTMTFDLDNSESSSGAVRGYYSPGSDDARTGFGIGTPVRLVLSHPLYGDVPKWVGTIESVKPHAGIQKPVAKVACIDWMDEAARAKLSGLAVETDIQSDELFDILVAVVEKQPPGGIMSGSGSDVYPYALDNTQDESSRVLGELQKLAMSEFGIIYVSAGALVFEGRRRRGGAGSVRWALHEDTNIMALSVSHARDGIINRAQVSVHPRRVDTAATTVLFNLGSATRLERGTSITISCAYRDPNQQAQRVGGVGMVPPVPSTDYEFNTLQSGLGTDITAQLDVVATFGGNSAEVTITNNGPLDGYIPANTLQLRGRGVYDFEPVTSDLTDATSLAAYGENVYAYDMPYQSNTLNANDLALFLLSLNKDPITRVDSVTFIANWDDEATQQFFEAQISERVSITAPSIGIDARPFFINGCSLTVEMNGVCVVTWPLAPVDTSQFWLLGISGRSELDETTVLGYGLFAAGWILDTSVLGTDTFLS